MSGCIKHVQAGFKPLDTAIYKGVSHGLTDVGQAVTNLSGVYDKVVNNTLSACAPQKHQETVRVLLQILPVAAAILIFANPMTLTAGLLGKTLMVGLVLLSTPDLLTKDTKVRLCQGGALAAGLQTTVNLVSAAAYGMTGAGVLAFLGGVGVTGLCYYASRHYAAH